jgi:hypothetical protein
MIRPIVPWSRLAAINRMRAPGSEWAIEERWSPATALEDFGREFA